MVKLSAFADEISQDFQEQADHCSKNGVNHIEVRGVWGKNVMQLNNDELARIKKMADDKGVGFSAVGSPLGKFPIDGDFAKEIESTKRALEIAHTLGCSYIRIFSYFIPEGESPDKYRAVCTDRVGQLAELCEGTSVKCALENEHGIYGDTAERCADLFRSINSPNLVGVFDPANYVVEGLKPYTDCWPIVKPYIEYFHIKDCLLDTRKMVPAGQGDGDIPQILGEAVQAGYNNFCTLEPHLQVAEASYGVTGPDLFVTAVDAIKGVLDDVGGSY